MKKVMESHGIFVGKFCMNPGCATDAEPGFSCHRAGPSYLKHGYMLNSKISIYKYSYLLCIYKTASIW